MNREFRPNAYRFIENEVRAGRQAYVICPMVEPSEMLAAENVIDYTEELRRALSPSIRVEYLHGKMKGKEKNAIMEAFAANEIHVLVSTTVIEVGINVPNATVMMIENAERFGLAQLHQLRGRVGRGSEQSFCVLMTDNRSDYTKARMDAMVRTTNGFEIAQEDLELRGPGNFFGREQHGLPPLKVADIADDAGLLTEADRVSAAILSADPQLTRPENELLRRNVERLFGGNGEYGWN